MEQKLIEAEFERFLYQNLVRNCNVLIGLSGGVDSVVLLHLLKKMSFSCQLNLHVIHVNHELRGGESDLDEVFCEKLCQSMDIPITCIKKNIKHLSLIQKTSIELTARNFRKAVFLEYANRWKCRAIFLGHNLDDQVETLLFRLGRGAGFHGMMGIREFTCVKGLSWCRPLLSCSKDAIRKWAKEHLVSWREDISNKELTFTRNRLRHEAIPLLEKIFQGSFSRSILRFSEFCNQFSTWFEECILSDMKESAFQVGKHIFIDIPKCENLHRFIWSELLRNEFYRGNFEILPDYVALSRLYQLMFLETGKVYPISDNWIAQKDRGFLHIFEKRGSLNFKPWISKIENTRLDFPYQEASHGFYSNWLQGKHFSFKYAFKEPVTLEKMTYRFIENEHPKNLKLGFKPLNRLFSEKKVPLCLFSSLPLVFYEGKLILIPGVAGDGSIVTQTGKGIEVGF